MGSGRICIDVFMIRVQRRVSWALRQICWEEGVQSKSWKVEVLGCRRGVSTGGVSTIAAL